MNNKKELLLTLYELWEQYPHLRFFQLINLLNNQLGDSYHTSNAAAMRVIKIMSKNFTN